MRRLWIATVLVFAFATVCFSTTGALADTGIQWRVEQPFRFFGDPKDTDMHRRVFEGLSEDQRKAAILNSERILSAQYPMGWAARMRGQTCWDNDKVRHICPNGASYIKPKMHRVIVRASAQSRLPAGAVCLWRFETEGRRVAGRRALKPGSELLEVRQNCTEDVRFEIPYPNGGKVTVLFDQRVIGSERIVVKDLFVVGMGDSFASGEGNPDVPVRFSEKRSVAYGDVKKNPELTGFPARVGGWGQIGDPVFVKGNAKWLDQACHRSLYSHQLRAALQLAIEDPHRAVTFLGLACSGAQIVDGLFLRYKGHEWVPNPPMLSQISAAAAAQCEGHEAPWVDLPEAYHINGQIPDLKGGLTLRKCAKSHARRIDLLLVSIGGNDVGFARLVANAVLPNQSTLRMLGGWLGQVHEAKKATVKFKELRARYKSLNRALHYILHVPWREGDRMVLTGYPPLALLEDGRSICPDGTAGMDVISEFYLTQRKARASDGVARALHGVMKREAKRHRWTFVEAHRKGFRGRGICAGYAEAAFSSVDDLRMPRFANGKWVPYSPAIYRPYASRQRWFRTPNDAFLTGNFHVSASLFQVASRQMRNLNWLQLLLASTYSGAFHPTAEGQAAIADAVVVKARKVLKRFGQASVLDRKSQGWPVAVERTELR